MSLPQTCYLLLSSSLELGTACWTLCCHPTSSSYSPADQPSLTLALLWGEEAVGSLNECISQHLLLLALGRVGSRNKRGGPGVRQTES